MRRLINILLAVFVLPIGLIAVGIFGFFASWCAGIWSAATGHKIEVNL